MTPTVTSAEAAPRAVRPSAPADSRYTIALLTLLGACIALLRPWWAPAAPPGVPVEVRGEVAAPGVYLLAEPTLRAAVEAAGGIGVGVSEARLRPGEAVFVAPFGPQIVRPGEPLLVGVPIDPAVDDAAAIAVVPALARAAPALVERQRTRPARSVDELDKVPGVGPRQLDALRQVAVVRAPPPGPVNLNTADAAALEALPGIGPTLAARIVADRAERGPFRSREDLDRVKGVGPKLVASLPPWVTAR